MPGPAQLSRYLRTRQNMGIVALFHQLKPVPQYCTLDTFHRIKRGTAFIGDADFVGSLSATGLVVSDPVEDDRTLAETIESLDKKLRRPSILYLMVSQECNMACEYCPVPAFSSQFKQTQMPVAIVTEGIETWLREVSGSYLPGQHYFIIFYGGEPLLNPAAIQRAVEVIEDKRRGGDFLPENLHLMLCTNGLLVTPAIAAYCRRHNIDVAVGIDADTADLNKARHDVTGDDTFDRVLKTLSLLSKSEVTLFASATITPQNCGQVPRIANFLAEQGVVKMGFNFLKGKGLATLSESVRQDYYHVASRALIELVQFWPRPNFEFQMQKKLDAFHEHEWFPVGCTCYGNQVVVQADGNMSTCPFQKDLPRDYASCVAAHRRQFPLLGHLESPSDAVALYSGECSWSNSVCQPMGVHDSGARIFAEEVLDELIWSKLTYSRIY